jgi:hypothetical protein
MAQSATVTLKDNGLIEVRHGPGSERFAGYLAKTLDQLNNPKGAQKALMAKAELGGTVLEANRLKQEKAQLLKAQAADWDERSRSTTLTPELKTFLAEKARRAYTEAQAIQKDLDGPKP